MHDRKAALVLRLVFVSACLFLLAVTSQLAAQDREGEQIDLLVVDESWKELPEDFTLRARVTKINPLEPADISWLHSKSIRGKLAEKLPVGQWSEVMLVASFKKGAFPKKLFVTLQVGRLGKSIRGAGRTKRNKVGYSTDVELEIEFSYKGKVVKTLKEVGPEGGSITILIPAYRLSGGKTPADPEFLNEVAGVHELALRRAAMLEALPWAKWPAPKRYAIINQLGVYGKGIGRGVKTTNIATYQAECRSLRQLGVNGIRRPPEFVLEMVASGKGFASVFGRGMIGHIMGYPVIKTPTRGETPPGAGCPYAPEVSKLTEEGIKKSLKMLENPVQEVWALTVDEIGTVIDRSPEKKRHLSVCPRCARGFQGYLKNKHLTPGDFGKKNWSEVKPLDIWGPPRRKRKRPAPAGPPSKPWKMPDVSDKHTALTAYHTAMFNTYVSGKMFTPLRDAFDRANAAKRAALSRGETDTPSAKQPWVYSYALRGNTFLMRGHSLDFFDFYRLSDNALVYETSNRGPRIWGWDSYLCDVGRIVSEKMNKRFGIYVKPHRGAPVQRGLSAVSRNVKMIYWYTYGPDYGKGDNFCVPATLKLTSKAAHLIGKTEDVLSGSSWAVPAEVAVVKPRTSEIWMRLSGRTPAYEAAWENAKWTYSALTHAHIPVDPLDEVMLTTEDLSKYRIIYVSGPNVTRAAGKALEEYVRAGGTLYTSGGGLARDEANQPLEVLQPVLGLEARSDPQMYYKVTPYTGGRIESYSDPGMVIAPVPDGAGIIGEGQFKASFKPVIGREILKPVKSAKVLARFADGAPAVTRHKYWKGQAYVVGFFPGLEYSAPTRTDRFNMARDFDGSRRSFVVAPAMRLTKPVVNPEQGTVEGVLLRNDATGKRAVTLMNWTYRVIAHRKTSRGTVADVGIVPFRNLRITIRNAGSVRRVTSAMLEKDLPTIKAGEVLTVTLPVLEEGDVLLLD